MPLRAIALRFIFVSPGRVYFLTAERRRHKEALRRSITGRGLRSLSLTLEQKISRQEYDPPPSIPQPEIRCRRMYSR